MGGGPGSLAVPPSLIYGRAGQPIRFWHDNRQNMRTRSIILFAARYSFIAMATSLFLQASFAISSCASAVRYLIRIYIYIYIMLPALRRYTQPGYLGPWLGFQPLRPFSPFISLLPSCFRRTRRDRSRLGRGRASTVVSEGGYGEFEQGGTPVWHPGSLLLPCFLPCAGGRKGRQADFGPSLPFLCIQAPPRGSLDLGKGPCPSPSSLPWL